MTAKEANGIITLETEAGTIISTTFVNADITCNNQSVIGLSQLLPPTRYRLARTSLLFEVITETVVLEPLPTPTPTPRPGQIEGRIWRDMDEDGIRDDDEPAVAEVSISLISACGDDLRFEAQHDYVISDPQGFFQFIGVNRILPNSEYGYVLRFDPDHAYTTPNQGEDEMLDSDARNFCLQDSDHCQIGTTDLFRMPLTGTVRGIDAGLLPEKLFFPVWQKD